MHTLPRSLFYIPLLFASWDLVVAFKPKTYFCVFRWRQWAVKCLPISNGYSADILLLFRVISIRTQELFLWQQIRNKFCIPVTYVNSVQSRFLSMDIKEQEYNLIQTAAVAFDSDVVLWMALSGSTWNTKQNVWDYIIVFMMHNKKREDFSSENVSLSEPSCQY